MRTILAATTVSPAFFLGCSVPQLPTTSAKSDAKAKAGSDVNPAKATVVATPQPVPVKATAPAPDPQPVPPAKSFDKLVAEGDRFLDDNENKSAVTAFTEAIKVDPTSARAFNSRGVAYLRMDKLASALDDFNKAIALGPPKAKFYSNRAFVHSDHEDFPKAIADLTKAIALEPNVADWYEQRAGIYYDMGDKVHSKSDYATAEKLQFGESVQQEVVVDAPTPPEKRKAISRKEARRATGRRLADWVWLELANNYDVRATFANVISMKEARVRFVNPSPGPCYSYKEGDENVMLKNIPRNADIDDSFAYQVEYTSAAGLVFRKNGYVEIGYDDKGTACVLGVMAPFLNNVLDGQLAAKRDSLDEALGRAFGR